MKVKAGQVYKQKDKPEWRKWEADLFVVTFAGFQAHTIDEDGLTEIVGLDWVKRGCDLIAEYPTWQEAVNSKEFNNASE